jgi:hypothetical protein
MMRTTASLHPSHHLQIEIEPLIFLLVSIHLHHPREKRTLLLLLLLLTHRLLGWESRILVVRLLLLPGSSSKKGPWIRAVTLAQWTNKKTKDHSVAALQT